MGILCTLGFHRRKIRYWFDGYCHSDLYCDSCRDARSEAIRHQFKTYETLGDFVLQRCNRCGEERLIDYSRSISPSKL